MAAAEESGTGGDGALHEMAAGEFESVAGEVEGWVLEGEALAVSFVSGPSMTRPCVFPAHLPEDQYAVLVAALQMDALRLCVMSRSGARGLVRGTRIFLGRYYQLREALSVVPLHLLEANRELDVPGQLEVALRYAETSARTCPEQMRSPAMALFLPGAVSATKGERDPITPEQWATSRMVAWEQIPIDFAMWPAWVGEPDLVVQDWKGRILELGLENGQMYPGLDEVRNKPKRKDRCGSGTKGGKQRAGRGAACPGARAESGFEAEPELTARRVQELAAGPFPGRALARALHGRANCAEALRAVAEFFISRDPPPLSLLGAVGDDAQVRRGLHLAFMDSGRRDLFVHTNNLWGDDDAFVDPDVRRRFVVERHIRAGRLKVAAEQAGAHAGLLAAVAAAQLDALRLPPGTRVVRVDSDGGMAALRGALVDVEDSASAVYIGLDCEFYWSEDNQQRLATLQLAFPDCVYVVLMPTAGRVNGVGDEAGEYLDALLTHAGCLVFGYNICEDVRVLALAFPTRQLALPRIIDVGLLCGGRSLVAACHEHLGAGLDKSLAASSWGGKLTDAQVSYAALDAVVTRQLACLLHQVVE